MKTKIPFLVEGTLEGRRRGLVVRGGNGLKDFVDARVIFVVELFNWDYLEGV